jgi:hypothetical protein
MMNKFKWGNMDQPGVYLDETILRQTSNFRNIFYRLAAQLVVEGKKDSAIKALIIAKKWFHQLMFLITFSQFVWPKVITLLELKKKEMLC